MKIAEFLKLAAENLEPGELPADLAATDLERAIIVIHEGDEYRYSDLLADLLGAYGYAEDGEIDGLCRGIKTALAVLARNPAALDGCARTTAETAEEPRETPDGTADTRATARLLAVRDITNAKNLTADEKLAYIAPLLTAQEDAR